MLKQVLSCFVLSLILTQALRAEDDTISMAEGKIVAHKPEDWKSVKPKFNMIQHEFVAPKDGENQARITISQAGGSIDQNIDRWVLQFDGFKKEDAKIEEKEVGKIKVHTVDMAGTFLQKAGGPFSQGPTEKLENYRLLGVIIETKDSGKIFIKMTGPNDTVEKLKDGMTKLVDSIEEK